MIVTLGNEVVVFPTCARNVIAVSFEEDTELKRPVIVVTEYSSTLISNAILLL